MQDTAISLADGSSAAGLNNQSGEKRNGAGTAAELAAVVNKLLPTSWRGLRSDLRLHRGPVDEWQQPTWTLEDPVSDGLFRLGRDEHDLLLCLTIDKDLQTALARYRRQHGKLPTPSELLPFLTMLQQQQLHATAVDVPEAQPSLVQRLKKLMFLRLPLVKPDNLLTRYLPFARILASKPLLWLYSLLGIIGLLRVVPQWEAFVASGGYLFTPRGALLFFVCLAVTKILHEFAHGFSAKAKGLYVSEMGVMLILLWPILYTNTTQAWKLPDRQQRFLIDSAGIRFELALAAIALFLWGFTGTGLLRNMLFFIASAALITTLLVNLNPFMRFDGYYMLMDAWRTDNLQPRGLSLAQHKMRRLLWDWQAEAPEQHPEPRRLALFGVATFSYRVLIGVTLAALVYRFIGAQPGALAFVLVFSLLVLSPMVQEIGALYSQRGLMGKPWRIALSLLLIVGFIILLTLPFSAKQSLPAMLVLADELTLTASEEGLLNSELPKVGDKVATGQTLALLENPALRFERQQTALDIEIQQARISALAASGEQGALRTWLLADTQRLEQRLATFNAASTQLSIAAPRNATVLAINEQLQRGDTIARGGYILTIGNSELQLQALLSFREASELQDSDLQTAEVRFGDALTEPVTAKLVNRQAYQPLPRNSLFDSLGGPIATVELNGVIQPRDAYQTLTYRIDKVPEYLSHGRNVRLWVNGPRRSVLGRMRDFVARQLSGDGVI